MRADWSLFASGLASLGRAPSDVAAILLTHAHADHTGFAERARADHGTPVWVHEADRGAAMTGKVGQHERGFGSYLRYYEAWRTLFGLLAHGGTTVVPVLKVSTFEDGQELDLPGRPRILHAPGHTAGMAAVHLQTADVLCTGDALVTRNPLTGRRGPQIMPAALNVDSTRALASLERLGKCPARLVLPGHGEPWSDGAAEAVRRALAAGRS